jgi:hypothetical protein
MGIEEGEGLVLNERGVPGGEAEASAPDEQPGMFTLAADGIRRKSDAGEWFRGELKAPLFVELAEMLLRLLPFAEFLLAGFGYRPFHLVMGQDLVQVEQGETGKLEVLNGIEVREVALGWRVLGWDLLLLGLKSPSMFRELLIDLDGQHPALGLGLFRVLGFQAVDDFPLGGVDFEEIGGDADPEVIDRSAPLEVVAK